MTVGSLIQDIVATSLTRRLNVAIGVHEGLRVEP